MQTFTGLEYIKIAAANEFGKDKLTWVERIKWFDDNLSNLRALALDAANKFLYIKALNAYDDAMAGKPTGYIMSLDATASGLQIMACLSGCKKTALAVNLIDPTERKDVYTAIAHEMNQELPQEEKVSRAIVKKPLMTHYYNKSRQPDFSELQEAAFYRALGNAFSGAEDVMDTINQCWDETKLSNTWRTPDGHMANVKVTDVVDTKIEVDELDHTTFTYRYTSNRPSKRSSSLCPNYIHSIDAWVAREMVRRAHRGGFQLAHIHDSFWASPNHMNEVRNNYRMILSELAASDALKEFIKDVIGQDVAVEKDSDDLAADIMKSEYALS